jgi:Tfp pilus assembly protein PilF
MPESPVAGGAAVIEQTSLQFGLDHLKAGRIDEAIEQLEKATVQSPEDYRAFNYLGVAYAQKKSYNRAVGALEKAAQLSPNIPSIHLNLGLAYQADGFPDRAREHFNTALSLDPSYERAAAALKSLDAEERSHISTQSCARHADEPAIAVCSFCHLPICAECKMVVDGQIYCTNCAGAQNYK